jgi:hypothetical protein
LRASHEKIERYAMRGGNGEIKQLILRCKNLSAGWMSGVKRASPRILQPNVRAIGANSALAW